MKVLLIIGTMFLAYMAQSSPAFAADVPIDVVRHTTLKLGGIPVNTLDAENSALDAAHQYAKEKCKEKGGKPPSWITELLSADSGTAVCKLEFSAGDGYSYQCRAYYLLTCDMPVRSPKTASDNGGTKNSPSIFEMRETTPGRTASTQGLY